MLNDTIKNCSRLMNKIFYVRTSLFFAVHCNIHFDSRCHYLQSVYTFVGTYTTCILCTIKFFGNTRVMTNL